MMTNVKMNESCASCAPNRGERPGLRGWAGRRIGLLTIAGAAIVAGLAFNWSWLVAAGVAPLIVGVLPCVAMCALGLCMMGITAAVQPPADAATTDAAAPPLANDNGQRKAAVPGPSPVVAE